MRNINRNQRCLSSISIRYNESDTFNCTLTTASSLIRSQKSFGRVEVSVSSNAVVTFIVSRVRVHGFVCGDLFLSHYRDLNSLTFLHHPKHTSSSSYLCTIRTLSLANSSPSAVSLDYRNYVNSVEKCFKYMEVFLLMLMI